MGYEAELLVMGPFEDRFLEYLDYSPWEYKEAKPGDTVVSTVVRCRTSESSRDLAEALGVGVMELHRHVFREITEEQRLALMRFVYGDGAKAADCWPEALDAFVRDGRFTFVYRPHG